MSERKRALKKRGILLATAGWALALTVLLALRFLGLVELGYRTWAIAVGLTAVVQYALWLIPARGLDDRLSWDPHYFYMPMLAAAVMLSYYAYLAPEAGMLLLMAWFAALLFMAGQAGLSDVVLLSGLVASGYMMSMALRKAEGLAEISLAFKGVETGVFFSICCFGAFVFRRLRVERRKMADLRRELAELAIRDPLTDLPNRRHFESMLRGELNRLRRYGGHCAVVMIDVDQFKIYNDSFGHVAGDRVLRELARELAANLRETDIVSRYGGEEFAVIMVDTPLERALQVLERLRAAIEAHTFPDEQIFPSGQLTISVGVTACRPDAVRLEDVVEEADRAMYAAKHAGRNRVEVATRAAA